MSDVGSAVLVAASSTCAFEVVKSLSTQSSLSHLWSIINSQQMIVKIPMFEKLKFPANVMTVVEQMSKLATFDLIPTEGLDEEMYNWPDEAPYSVSFESAGVESKLFLANIGLALYLIQLHVLAALVHAILHKLRNKCKCVAVIHRKLGSYLYWEGLNRFHMELFFDLALFSVLNLHTVEWDTPYPSVQASNALSVIVITSVCSILMNYIVGYFRRPRETRTQKFGADFSPLLNRTEYSQPTPKWYLILLPALFFAKRLLFVSLVVTANDHLWVQLHMLNIITVWSIMFMLNFPLDSLKANLLEIFNDATLLFLVYLLWSFTDMVGEPESRHELGFFFIGVIVFNISVQLALMLIQSIVDIRLKCKRYIFKKNEKKTLKNNRIRRGGRDQQ